MKDTAGHMLRETWKEQGKSECSHADLSKERSFSGVVTGFYICTVCGHLLQMTTEEANRSKQPTWPGR